MGRARDSFFEKTQKPPLLLWSNASRPLQTSTPIMAINYGFKNSYKERPHEKSFPTLLMDIGKTAVDFTPCIKIDPFQSFMIYM